MREQLQSAYEHFRYFYLSDRFFIGIAGVVLVSIAGFYAPFVFYLAIASLVILVLTTLYDVILLYRAARGISASRKTPKVLSLSDPMTIHVMVRNDGKKPVRAVLIDELPEQLQIRDHEIAFELGPDQEKKLTYPIRPVQRGEYEFGNLNIFLTTRLGLGERRVEIPQHRTVPVYPSIVQMRHFALRAKTTVPAPGLRRMRRFAKSYEFDQIKNYVLGDDFRSINWKATGRHQKLMVNQYEDERAQRVFCVIDKGRTMLMPFNGLSLLDYAINATLALSNVILKRQDRAGLVTFSDKIGTVLPADSKPDHLRRLLEALYRQEERQKESNYDLLYYASRKLLGGRSLIILFTNFESNYALDRVLPGLRKVSRAHQLVVVLFENTEIADVVHAKTESVEDIYRQSTARNFIQQRQLMAARLRQNGIKVVLTRPQDLTGEVINKYLELKSRGVI
ncbi:DUF58 domain-containing protein [Neolewinella antarctica]|uniref:Uncharacterized protein (DUF58 family) n=1 Tax=Neolewinella antarctica TaxID=442734 RepID=A0ABX0XD13_9BACT|nr:DUF58 domain-containing protein [Neolewinella antarctica]NJC26718.1 uncharacterized protein (DUF58 family) [Neolewinella antarctica]